MRTTINNVTAVADEQTFSDDEYVVDYLRGAPGFFARNPELLMEIEVPHQHKGTVSLVERRLTMQREQYTELEQQLAEIVDVAHQNDHLSELLHDYSVGLISAGSLAEVFTFTRNILKNRLRCDISGAVIRQNDVIDVCANGLSDYVSLVDESTCASMRNLHKARSVYCGYPVASRVERFFPQQAAVVKSIAIIRLADTTSVKPINPEDNTLCAVHQPTVTEFGYLALASNSKQRFAPHMGTDFLSRFGALLSARLAVFY